MRQQWPGATYTGWSVPVHTGETNGQRNPVDYWRFLLRDGACEIRWFGRKPTSEDVQMAIDALLLAKRALADE